MACLRESLVNDNKIKCGCEKYDIFFAEKIISQIIKTNQRQFNVIQNKKLSKKFSLIFTPTKNFMYPKSNLMYLLKVLCTFKKIPFTLVCTGVHLEDHCLNYL